MLVHAVTLAAVQPGLCGVAAHVDVEQSGIPSAIWEHAGYVGVEILNHCIKPPKAGRSNRLSKGARIRSVRLHHYQQYQLNL